ncbi:20523_t:CDS:2 [Rhizophagus irregularis]|nr:20523_t:CDS:2 [Rhizophagus irregularis]
MQELGRLLASNEDFLITIDDKKLPEIPFNYVQPSNNNTPRPNNTPPFNNTSQPNKTPPFNNTPLPNNTEMPVISVRNAESLNANSN